MAWTAQRQIDHYTEQLNRRIGKEMWRCHLRVKRALNTYTQQMASCLQVHVHSYVQVPVEVPVPVHVAVAVPVPVAVPLPIPVCFPQPFPVPFPVPLPIQQQESVHPLLTTTVVVEENQQEPAAIVCVKSQPKRSWKKTARTQRLSSLGEKPNQVVLFSSSNPFAVLDEVEAEVSCEDIPANVEESGPTASELAKKIPRSKTAKKKKKVKKTAKKPALPTWKEKPSTLAVAHPRPKLRKSENNSSYRAVNLNSGKVMLLVLYYWLDLFQRNLQTSFEILAKYIERSRYFILETVAWTPRDPTFTRELIEECLDEIIEIHQMLNDPERCNLLTGLEIEHFNPAFLDDCQDDRAAMFTVVNNSTNFILRSLLVDQEGKRASFLEQRKIVTALHNLRVQLPDFHKVLPLLKSALPSIRLYRNHEGKTVPLSEVIYSVIQEHRRSHATCPTLFSCECINPNCLGKTIVKTLGTDLRPSRTILLSAVECRIWNRQ